jgi:serine/threonine protein kinase
VTVTDAGTTTGGVPFYVMERLDGETLAMRMRKVRRFPIPEALAIVGRILEGLAAAHQIGVVHRDIKPPNVFLVGAQHPKILDFGVAKIADDPGVVTARGVAIGTPRYMSPEQARGEPVDSRSDIYSSGLILFEMVTGVNPFEDARDSKELLVAHLTRTAPRLSSLVRGVPPELDLVLASMLAKEPERRPAMAREVAAELARVCERWIELVAQSDAGTSAAEAVSVLPLVSAAPIDDTTRPDGVASRTRPLESSSAGRIAWTRDSDVEAQKTGTEASPFETTAAAVRALTGSGGLLLEVPAGASAPLTRTEILAPTPVPPTRTRAPVTPSETPSSRKLAGAFQPEPIPAFRSPGRWVPWLGLSAVALGLALAGLFGFDRGPQPGRSPAMRPAASKAGEKLGATSAVAASPTPPAPTAHAPAPAVATPTPTPSSDAAPAVERKRAARSDTERRTRAELVPTAQTAAPSPPAAKRPAPDQGLPASGL